MEQIVVKGIEVQFNDLTEEKQKELYEQYQEKFGKEVINSQYASIRKKVIENTTNTDILNTIFMLEVENYGNYENIEKIWNHPNFEKTDEKRKMLADSDDCEERLIVAEDKESPSELLNEMFRKEVQGDHDEDVIEAIQNNPNFEMKEENLKVLAKSSSWKDRLIVAQDEKSSSELLNEMFQKEIQGDHDDDVIEAIQDNHNFEMEEETLEVLAKSDNWEERLIAAQDEKSSSELLIKMFRKEIQEDNDCDVIETIQNNPNFEMDEETLKVLAESDDWEDRLKVAQNEKSSSELLNEMFRKEVRGDHYGDVIEVIQNNLNFEMEEETLKVLAESDDWEDRLKAAQDEKSSSEFLNEMFRKEIQGDHDDDIIETIQNNPNFEMDEESKKVFQS